MGIFNKKKPSPAPAPKTTLAQDIPVAAAWVVKALNSSGYPADNTQESMTELDRFFDEQSGPGGILSQNRGQILFGLGSYVGETAIRLWGGKWLTDDSDPEGEMNIAVELASGVRFWPVVRCMKRCRLGPEESLHAYLLAMK